MNNLMNKLTMNTILFFIGMILIDILIIILLFKILFKNRKKLKNDIGYAITPDIISLLRGKYIEDQISEFKIGLFAFIIIGILAINVFIITQLL